MKVAREARERAPRERPGEPRSAARSGDRVVRHLKLNGAWEEADAQLELDDAVRLVARAQGLGVDHEALQQGVDQFREESGLASIDATLKWLEQTKLTLEDIEAEVEVRLLEDALCDSLDRRQVEEEFRKVRIRFDLVLLRVFVVDGTASGMALATQLRSARDAVARPDVLERCVGQRMEWGWYFREELPERAAAQVFKSLPGAVVGPLEIGEASHAVYCVDAFRRAMLDADVERQIRKELVAERARNLMQPDDPGRFVLK